MLDAEFKLAVETLKGTRARRAQGTFFYLLLGNTLRRLWVVLATGSGGKGKDSPAARLEQQVRVEDASAARLKFLLDYVTRALFRELARFHERKGN